MDAAVLVSIFLPFLFLMNESKAEQEKARARRTAENHRNARLLRFNL